MHPNLRTLMTPTMPSVLPLTHSFRRNIFSSSSLGFSSTGSGRTATSLHSAPRASTTNPLPLHTPRHSRQSQCRHIAVTAMAPANIASGFPHLQPGPNFNVVMIGAGNIMFGSPEGPWNHSFRFEHKLGPRLKVVALIDPSHERAESALNAKRASFVEPAYRDTKVFPTIEDYHHYLQASQAVEPNAIVVGCPPAYRGGTTKGTDLEINLIKLFPKTAYFIEKPVGTGAVDAAKLVTQHLLESGNVVSVGYMLRYLRCVQEMQRIIKDNNLNVMTTNARFSCAYEHITKPAWWNKSLDMGPVIEQGTHFCDLSRYLGGDVDLQSVSAHSVEFYEKPGKLSKMPVDESAISEDLRIPRVTSAVWKYVNGGTGTFTHVVGLQGHKYDCELDVWADGYHMRLIDPYNAPTLYVRRPGDDAEERHIFADDDPFFSEVSNFIDHIENGPDGSILSSFEDATKTYELTWAIRLASEASRARMSAA